VKYTNNARKIVPLVLVLSTLLIGCGKTQYEMPFTTDYNVGGFNMGTSNQDAKLITFATSLCVVNDDILIEDTDLMPEPYSAALFDLDSKETLYAKNVHVRLNPASLTKVLTAIVALKYGNLDDVVTVGNEINNLEYGAQTCGLEVGDELTMTQLMYALLVWSANDAALVIATHVGGSVEEFCNMMNKEALSIGATNSHFMNPHGLTQEDHYVTLYDMYLLFNEATHYNEFLQIIQTKTYKSVYYDKNKDEKELSFTSTNLFFRGYYEAPSTIQILGGKTGTTDAAANCVILYVYDSSNHPYIAIAMRAADRDMLYNELTDLLGEIRN